MKSTYKPCDKENCVRFHEYRSQFGDSPLDYNSVVAIDDIWQTIRTAISACRECEYFKKMDLYVEKTGR